MQIASKTIKDTALNVDTALSVNLLGRPQVLPLRAVSLRRPFNSFVSEAPQAVLSVPSMMTEAERRFLYGLGSRYYTGAGAIVDAGLFMGASTVCFGEGVRNNPNYSTIKRTRQKPIISLERGIVNAGMPAFFERHKIQFDGAVGDSFEPILRSNIENVEKEVDLRIGDILEKGNVDDEIEILFLDVIKSVEIARFVLKEYMPKLIPGRSLVLQQDYFIDLLPYLKTYQEFLSPHFAYVGEIGPMAVFLCTSKPDIKNTNLDATLDKATQLQLASVAMQRSVDQSRRFMMAISKCRLIHKFEGAEAASAYLRHIESDYPEMIMAAERPGRIREVLASARKLLRTRTKSVDEEREW